VSLAEALRQYNPRPPRKSVVDALLESLEPEDREALEKALHDPSWPASAIQAVLEGQGYRFSKSTIQDYVRKVRKGA